MTTKLRLYSVVNTDTDGKETDAPRVVIAINATQAIRHVSKPLEATPLSGLELALLQTTFPDIVIEKAAE